MREKKKLTRIVPLGALATATALWATGSFPFTMIQNTAVGRQTAGTQVQCNDPGGFIHWKNKNISWYHNTANQGSGKAAALQAAMLSWTNVVGASHVLTYAGKTTAGWATDGMNTILWAKGNGCTYPCMALTALVLRSGQVIVESDITFNNDDFTWRTNGSDADTQAVAAHELGHALGIHHTQVVAQPHPTMYSKYFGVSGRTLELDDRLALRCAETRYP